MCELRGGSESAQHRFNDLHTVHFGPIPAGERRGGVCKLRIWPIPAEHRLQYMRELFRGKLLRIDWPQRIHKSVQRRNVLGDWGVGVLKLRGRILPAD
jgi:hypothetical protein